MDPRIWLLAGAQFAAATGAYAFTGMLGPLADELGVSLASAGQLTAAYALTYAVLGGPAAGFTARWDRRDLLVLGLVLVGVLTLAAAFVSDFTTMLVLRIATGAAITLVLPGVAASMLVPAPQRAKALAIVLGGLTIAFSFGIPLGSVIGGIWGWRACFVFGGLLALGAALACRIGLPALPSTDRGGMGSARRVLRGELLTVLGTSGLTFVALFCVVAYLGPIVTATTGITGGGIGAIQVFVGIGSVLGIWLGSRPARGPGLPVALVLLLGATLVGYSLVMLPAAAAWHAVPLALCVFAGSVGLFALAPIMQTRLISLAPEDRAVALALNGAVALGGQGLGAAYGGVVIATLGLEWTGFAGAILAFATLPLALVAFRRPTSA